MSVEKVYAKDASLAGKEVKRPGRVFEIKAQDFTSAEQGVPIRLMAGTARMAGTYITPVFGFRKEPKPVEGGK